MKLLSIDLKTCNLLGILGCSTGVGDGGSFNLKVQTNIAPTTQILLYTSPTLQNINQTTYYKTFGSNANVLTIGDTNGSLITTSYTPPAGKTVTGSLLQAVAGLITTLSNDIVSALNSILVSIVNPIINTLLNALGVKVAVADVGANLSCGQGGRAQLVL